VIGVQLMSVLYKDKEFEISKNVLIIIEEEKLRVTSKNKKDK